MSDRKKPSSTVVDYYDDLFELNGAVMDKASYEKHTAALASSEPPATTQPLSNQSTAVQSPFDQPQDFRQLAAQAIEADQQMEYHPEIASFVVLHEETGEYIETGETYHPGEMRMILGAPHVIRTSSGSYRTSGSYRLSSGSYRITSGSYRLSSGSYRLTSGSYRLSSGSYRFSSGSRSFRGVIPPAGEQPYTGSLLWGADVGGYGLNLI